MLNLAEAEPAADVLRHSLDLLYRVIEYNAAGMHIFDREGRFILSNAAVEQMYGIPRSVFAGLRYDDPRVERLTLSGEALPPSEHPFALVQRTGQPVYDIQYVVTPPNGVRRVVSVNAAPLFDSDGAFSGAARTRRDAAQHHARPQESVDEHSRQCAVLAAALGASTAA